MEKMANESTLAPRFTDPDYLLRELNDAEVQRLIPTVAFLTLIAAFGIIGNGVVVHIYRTRYKISNAKLFIMCVGAIDLFSCAIAIPFEIPLLLEQYTFENVWLCKISRIFNTLGTCSSSFILLFIAIDRYRKVCKPLARQITPKSARYLCLFSVLLGVLVAWPAGFVYGKKTFQLEINNLVLEGSECSTSDSMSHTNYPFYYAALFGVLFIVGITSMSILYCLIGCKIQRQTRKMSHPFTSRSMSIPATSSIINDRDSRKSGEIIPGAQEKYELARKKNEELDKKKTGSRKKRCESFNDDSWTDKKEFELSFEYNDTTRNREKSPTAQSNGVVRHINEVCENDDGIQTNNEVCANDGVEIQNCRQNGSSVSIDASSSLPDSDKNISTPSLTSGTDVMSNPGGKTFRKRVSSIGSRISHALTRMTSITSATTDFSYGGTLRKNQYLKQARARKTAFIMFVISLAYIISYLPHLILMVTRQVNSGFEDGLTESGRAAYKFFLRSYFLNCAINPVIYGVCDSRFRAACVELFGRCRCAGSDK